MTPAELRTLLEAVSEGTLTSRDAHARILAALRDQPFEDLGFARVDHHRSIRQGIPEVILGLGKTAEQIAIIAGRIVDRGQALLITRADEAVWEHLRTRIPGAHYHPVARAITLARDMPPGQGVV